MASSHSLQDVVWILICVALLMFMQAGFCCLESGLVRSKNSINVAIKNLFDFCVSAAVFWIFGFAIMFGESFNGLFGTTGFFFGENIGPWLMAFFLFQLFFCSTAITIVSGATAERIRFSGYITVSIIISGLIYPFFGHWAWGGTQSGTAAGWLKSIGFIDFAGSTVVHSVGGWVALAAVIIIGPRIGRFGKGGREIHGHDIPVAALGTFLLWVGWFGFNGGSTLEVNDKISVIVANTTLAAVFGGITASILSWIKFGLPDVRHIMNGILAGLVAITASCNIMTLPLAVCIGAIAGVISLSTMLMLENLNIDDAIGAISVHAFAGVWGTLAVAIFGNPATWGTGLGRWDQFFVQLTGVGVCFIWAFGLGFALLWLVNRWLPLRVSAEDEKIGLNVAEHGAKTDLLDLLTGMEKQRRAGDFSKHVHTEPHTEVGQIAMQYNNVLDKVNSEIEKEKLLTAELERSNRELQDFAYVASHDMQEPLRKIQAFSDRLSTKFSETLGEQGRDYMERMQSAAKRMQTLINDLLSFSRVTAKAKPFVPVDLAKVVREVLSDLEISIKEANGRVEISNLPTIDADPMQMRQLFQNLIGNSLKFSRSNENPVIKIFGSQIHESDKQHITDTNVPVDELYQITVEDNGIGFDEKYLDRIFTIFQRLHGRDEYKGTGVGLAICRKIVERHNGNIAAKSAPGQGAAFIITLPIKQPKLERGGTQ